MTSPVLLDTHIWLWWLLGQNELGPKDRQRLHTLVAAGTPPSVSAISLWEVQMLVSKGRLPLSMPLNRWLPLATSPETVRILPLDADVVLAVNELPESFHGDPADRIIVATARAHGLPLLTRDMNIRRSRVARLW
ncbi:MAG: type II toxin-antitoxin system VapC family toxin [Rubrivivax sp.]